MFFTTTTTILFGLATLGFTSAAPTSNSNSNSQLETRGTYDGMATYYYQGGNPGSCGDWHSDADYIVAVNSPQQSGSCGKKVKITNTKNGKTATALAADTCPTCDYGSLDMSEGLFTFLGDGDMGQGEFPISWHFTSSE